jgi:hypothetical protein
MGPNLQPKPDPKCEIPMFKRNLITFLTKTSEKS